MTAFGYYKFISLNPLYWFIVAPFVFVFSVYYIISYGINLFYPGFDVSCHRKLVEDYWNKTKNEPSVDVFLPTIGEELMLLEKTYKAVSALKYKNIKVYVLDDKGDKKITKLANKYKFKYLSRDNKGYMRKAGNLKFGYENSRGNFIAIFDADFCPRPDFIHDLLPYMSDPKNAIVQSPQYFQADAQVHKRSALEYGAAHVQEDFYRIIQVARDRFDGAICVGSNALYRRAALNKIGGTAQIEHSEDVHTGFNLMLKGYKVKYIPLILAVGLCPDELHSYFHQQHRWANGSMSLLFSRKFWKAKISLAQRLCFISGFLYYITHTLVFFMAFFVFLILFFHFDYIRLSYAVWFYPYLIYSFILLPSFRISKIKFGSYLARVAHMYSYTHAFWSRVVNKQLGWHATNTEKSRLSKEFIFLWKANAAYLLIYITFVSLAIATNRFPALNINYYSVLFWIWFNLFVHALFQWHAFKLVSTDKKISLNSSLKYNYWFISRVGVFLGVIILLVSISIVYAMNHPRKTTIAINNSSGVIPQPRRTSLLTPTPTKIEQVKNELIETQCTDTYLVAEGDCLWTIAEKRLGDPYKWVDLVRINNIQNPDLIFTGTTIQLETDTKCVNKAI